ncbi:HSP70-domain-containing protein [Gigaspora margarita]|uniref:HSP70-domain-containing protein n=1 Tax=Gigaspora margarita TaxID=4874 RepID=A0A8H4A9C7_GIGMA|nr:HSP70-domain-containing protein [Gigaspora margarita]
MPSATDSKKSIIGLRIGQSYSSIAIINKDGRADCIANEDGERQIPTLVAFAGEEELAGTQAKALLLSNSKNTISQFRNFIGKSFAECNSSVIKGTAQLVDKDENNLDTQLIDEVILVGGASRIPKLQSKLRDTFNNTITVIRQDFEPDEVVAYGCAFQGDLIGDLDDQMIADSIDSSVTLVPHLSKPIGILNAENEFVVIIPGNTPLPARRIFQFSNMIDDQKNIFVPIWEGDIIIPKPSSQTDNNLDSDSTLQGKPNLSPSKLLAELVLTDLPEKKINELKVDITIEIDINQKCIILAKESTSNKSVEIEIQITQ